MSKQVIFIIFLVVKLCRSQTTDPPVYLPDANSMSQNFFYELTYSSTCSQAYIDSFRS